MANIKRAIETRQWERLFLPGVHAVVSFFLHPSSGLRCDAPTTSLGVGVGWVGGGVRGTGCPVTRAPGKAPDSASTTSDLWPKVLSQVDRYEPEIQTVARKLFWRGRFSGIDIEVLIGGGWTPPRWA